MHNCFKSLLLQSWFNLLCGNGSVTKVNVIVSGSILKGFIQIRSTETKSFSRILYSCLTCQIAFFSSSLQTKDLEFWKKSFGHIERSVVVFAEQQHKQHFSHKKREDFLMSLLLLLHFLRSCTFRISSTMLGSTRSKFLGMILQFLWVLP